MPSFLDFVTWRQNFVRAYCEAQSQLRLVSHGSGAGSLSPPPQTVIKINVDTGFPSQRGECWIAMIAMNNTGECVWWSQRRIAGKLWPVDGEALAIQHGLGVVCA